MVLFTIGWFFRFNLSTDTFTSLTNTFHHLFCRKWVYKQISISIHLTTVPFNRDSFLDCFSSIIHPTIDPSIHFTFPILPELKVIGMICRFSQLPYGKGRMTPWTNGQVNAGPKRDKQWFVLMNIPIDYLEFPVGFTCMFLDYRREQENV